MLCPGDVTPWSNLDGPLVHTRRGGTFSTLSCVTGLFFVFFHAEKESENRLFLMLILTLLSACFCFNVLS